MGRKKVRVQQHADGYEKDARKVVPERHDLCHDMVAILGFGYNETGEEGAERERQAETVGDPGRAEAEQHHKEEEYLAVSEADHLVKQERHDLARREEHNYQSEKRLAQGFEHRKSRYRPRSGRLSEDGEQKHHGHDRKVLKQQDAG